jgi:hypothetical protein
MCRLQIRLISNNHSTPLIEQTEIKRKDPEHGGPVFRLSIIVPFLGDLKRFEDTLVSVLENRPDQSQVVVVLNQPYDDPYELRDEVQFVQAPQASGLVDCFDWGVAASQAPVVHFLAPGIEATAGWADTALEHFEANEGGEANVAAVAPLLVDRNDQNRVLSAGLAYSSAGAITRLATGQSLESGPVNTAQLLGPEMLAAFYRREALQSVDTMGERHCGLAAAADLALSLRQAGYACVAEAGSQVLASWQDLQGAGPWQEGLAAERLFHRWPEVPGGRRSWFSHAILVGMECLQIPLRPSSAARAAARLWVATGLSKSGQADGSKRFGLHSINGEAGSANGPHFLESHEYRPSRVAG